MIFICFFGEPTARANSFELAVEAEFESVQERKAVQGVTAYCGCKSPVAQAPGCDLLPLRGFPKSKPGGRQVVARRREPLASRYADRMNQRGVDAALS